MKVAAADPLTSKRRRLSSFMACLSLQKEAPIGQEVGNHRHPGPYRRSVFDRVVRSVRIRHRFGAEALGGVTPPAAPVAVRRLIGVQPELIRRLKLGIAV